MSTTSASLRLAFMGSPDFAVPTLTALIAAGHEIACVYTQPPRRGGRGHKQRPCPVHAFAADQGMAVRTPLNFKDPAGCDAFAGLKLDAAVVVAYGLILPRAVLDAPRFGCFNVHGSLLPRWRGAAPIHRAVLAGDTKTGVTIMGMDEGLDTGPVYLTEEIPIGPRVTVSEVHDQLAAIGGPLMIRALEEVSAGDLRPVPQASDGVTYASKLSRQESRINWHLPADQIERHVRGLNPWPGLWFAHEGTRIKVLAADLAPGEGPPGQVLAAPLIVACGTGAIAVTRLQRPGKNPLAADDYVRGNPLPVGTDLGTD